MYTRKTKDEYVLQCNYGTGWEDMIFYDTYREAKIDYKAYVENDKQGIFKIVKRRIKL